MIEFMPKERDPRIDSATVAVTLRFQGGLLHRLRVLASQRDRSLNAQLVRWLSWIADETEAGRDPAP